MSFKYYRTYFINFILETRVSNTTERIRSILIWKHELQILQNVFDQFYIRNTSYKYYRTYLIYFISETWVSNTKERILSILFWEHEFQILLNVFDQFYSGNTSFKNYRTYFVNAISKTRVSNTTERIWSISFWWYWHRYCLMLYWYILCTISDNSILSRWWFNSVLFLFSLF